jgi:hypothetical protein
MSKINIIEKVKAIKPTVSNRVLCNHKSVYNICFKHFKNDSFLENTEAIKQFFETRYKNIKSRKSNYYILKTICIALGKNKEADLIDSYAKEINKILEKEKKKMLESIDIPKKPNQVHDMYDLIYEDIKNRYIKAKKEVYDFYDDKKISYTLDQLKKIRNLLIFSIYCSCYCDEDKYSSINPPRRNEIRLLHIYPYKLLTRQAKLHNRNYIMKPIKNANIFTGIKYCCYKQTAKKCHGIQTLKISKEINKILNMYLKTHTKLLKGIDMLFPKAIYEGNRLNIQLYTPESWSKLLSRIIGYGCNDIRKAFVTKTYKTLMPSNNSVKQLAYRMGHTFSTAMEHYNKIPKNIK